MKLVVIVLLFVATAFAQHAFTPEDIAEGGRLYQSNCAGCHGSTGDQVQGVALMSGKFRRATSDEEAAGIIRKGVPGTAMQPFNFTEQQAGSIIAYLKAFAGGPAAAAGNDAPLGDAARGKQLFEGKGGCTSCHRIGENGSRSGPDLSSVGIPRPPSRFVGFGGPPPGPPSTAALAAELRQKLIAPEANVAPENRTYRAVLKNGQTVTGRLLNLDTFTVQLFDSNERLVGIQRADLRQFGVVASPMPSYRDRLSDPEILDLVAYLVSLKGQAQQ